MEGGLISSVNAAEAREASARVCTLMQRGSVIKFLLKIALR